MGQKELREELKKHSKVFVDTPAFLYFFEENPDWLDLTITIFELAEEKEIKIITSSITVLEVLTGLEKEGSDKDKEEFKNMINDFGVEVVGFKEKHATTAAYLRVEYNLKSPDAIQLAIAIEEDIAAFVTNDQQLTKINESEVIYLGSYK